MIGEKTKIFVAGHRGFVGSALVRTLRAKGFPSVCFRSRGLLDLRDRESTFQYFEATRPRAVVMCAATPTPDESGGEPYDLAGDMGVVCNMIDAAHQVEVEKFIFIACASLYPKRAKQPLDESLLLSENDNSPRGDEDLGRLIGIRQCEALWNDTGEFVSLVSGDLYGPGNVSPKGRSQMLSSLILRILLAKENGDLSVKCVRGVPVLNELLYVDDLASACLPLLRSKVECPILNVGSGLCPTVESLGEMIASEIGYSGTLEWVGKPPRRERPCRLRCDRIHDLGWRPITSLEQGLRRTIQDLRARLHWSGVLGAKQNRARIDTRKSG